MPQFMGLKILRFGVLNADVIVVVAAWQSRVAGKVCLHISMFARSAALAFGDARCEST